MYRGFSNLHYSLVKNGVYQPPSRLSGAVYINFDEGFSPVFYNNYFIGMKQQQNAGTLETAGHSEQFCKDILNACADGNGVTLKGIRFSHFALMFEEQGFNGINYRHLLYNCIAFPEPYSIKTLSSDISSSVRTEKFKLYVLPYKNRYICTVSSDKLAYSTWFDEVYSG